MKQFNCGIIGCGAVAHNVYVPIFQLLETATLKAVCDRNQERAEKLVKQKNINIYNDLTTLLTAENLDVVIILTPPEFHCVMACQAMDAGCDVLIEKPFTYSLAEADQVIAKQQETGRRFSVIHNELFKPTVTELKTRVMSGEIGKICSVRFFSGRRNQTFIPEPWYFQTYGGRVGETLPHALYQLIEYFDDLVVEYVRARKLGHCIIPDVAKSVDVKYDELFVEFSSPTSNAIASLSYSFNSNQDLSLVVAGTEGTLLAYLSGKIVKWSATPLVLSNSSQHFRNGSLPSNKNWPSFFPKTKGKKSETVLTIDKLANFLNK